MHTRALSVNCGLLRLRVERSPVPKIYASRSACCFGADFVAGFSAPA